jgi:hypothetical protein
MTVEHKEDCPLYCGREAVKGIKNFWRFEAKDTLKDVLLKSWVVFSLPVFGAIIYGFLHGSIPDDTFWDFAAKIMIVITFFGIVADLVLIGFEISIRRHQYGLVMSESTSQAIDNHVQTAGRCAVKTAVKIWETGSPVLLVWLASSYHFGEFGTLANYGSFMIIFWVAVAACLPGCWHDIKYVFGSIAREAWNGRNGNLIGMIERTILRGIGRISIALRQCDLKKAQKN